MTDRAPDLQRRLAVANAVGEAFRPGAEASEVIRGAVGRLRNCPSCQARPPAWTWTESQSPSAAVWSSIVCRDCSFDVAPELGSYVIGVILASEKTSRS